MWKSSVIGLLVSGCVTSAEVGGKPQDEAEGTAGETQVDPTDDPTGDTEAETTAGETTAGETTAGTPVEPGRCVTQEGAAAGEWMFHCGSIAQESFAGAGVDADGNVYLGFTFRGWDETEFATLEIGDEVIENTGLADAVLVKLDPEGEVLWTRHFGGLENQYVGRMSLCADRIVITGTTEPGTLDLGGGVLLHEEYVAVLDLDGAHLWSRSFEVQEPDGWVSFAGLACDGAGNVVTSGSFRDGVDLGDGMIPAGVQDTFLAKHGEGGELLWARAGGATGSYAGAGTLAIAPGDEIVVAGSFDEELDLGGGPISAVDGEDAFIARYDGEGGYLWAEQVGPAGLQYTHGIAIAEDGTIALLGTFLSTIEIAGETFENVFPDQIPDKHGTVYDVFVATLDPTGAWGWAAHQGTMLDDQVVGQVFVGDALLVMAYATDGMYLDRYIDGARTTLRSLGDSTSMYSGLLAPADGGRILVGAETSHVGELTFADVTLEGHGLSDVIVGKLAL